MNDEIKKYQVVSSGEVLKGFSILDVSESLARLYKISSASAIDTLINGKPRKVRSARSKAHAESICAKLQSMGLRCGVSEVRPDSPDDISMHTHMVDASNYDEQVEEDIEALSESTDEAMASIDAIYNDATNKVAKSKFIKRFSIFAVVAGAIGFGSWFSINYWLKPQSPLAVNYIESGMQAVGSPLAMVYADIAQARKLSSVASLFREHSVIQTADFSSLTNSFSPLNLFKSQSFFKNTNFINASVYAKESSASSFDWLVVVSGNYDVSKIETYLSSNFKIIKSDRDLFELRPKKNVPDFNSLGSQCSLESSKAVTTPKIFAAVENDQLILSSTSELTNRFESKLTSLKVRGASLSDEQLEWQDFRNGSLFGINGFDPKVLKNLESFKLFLESNFSETSLDSMQVRLMPDLLKRGAKAQLKFTTSDDTELTQAAKKLNQNLTNLKAKSIDDFPLVFSVLENTKISTLDSEGVAIQLSLNALADFSGISADLNNLVAGGQLSKPIDSEVLSFKTPDSDWDFANNSSIVKRARKTIGNSFEPVYERQGVSIFVDSLNSTLRGTSVINLSAIRPLSLSGKQPGWSESGIMQGLWVNDVTNERRKSLISPNDCSQRAINNGTELTDDGFLNSDASIKINANLDDVHRLKGRYKLKVPIDVFSTNVLMTNNRRVNWTNGYLRLSRMAGSTVQYRVFGDDTALLAVKALNAQGQVLSKHSSQIERGLTTITFNGKVDRLQAFVAQNWQDEQFDFTLNSVFAKEQKQRLSNASLPIKSVIGFGRSERSKFRKKRLSEANAKKAIPVSSQELGRAQTKSAHMIFKIEQPKNASKRLKGVVIVPFNELLIANSDSLTVYIELNRKYKSEFKINFKDNKSLLKVNGVNYLQGDYSIVLDKRIANIERIEGALKFALPQRLSSVDADLKNAKSKDSAKAIRYEYDESPASFYRLNKDVDFAILTQGSGETFISQKTDQNRVITFSGAVGQAKNIELYRVSKTNRFTEKFTFRVK